MTPLSPRTISTKSIQVSEITLNNLDDFYDGSPYRYNAIIDLLSQGEPIKRSLLEALDLCNTLSYRIFFASNSMGKLPILECLEIDGSWGGMLSTYLHDFDRDILEGENKPHPPTESMSIWQSLMHQGEEPTDDEGITHRYGT